MARDLGEFDYVIVGAGTAGCLLANRLSADPSVRVLLVEAGGSDRRLAIRVPVGFRWCIGDPRTDWRYAAEPDAALAGRALGLPRGRGLGGSSSINGMVVVRGQAADYDGWRDRGNPGWGWDDVLPHFRASEDHHGGADAWHGSGGGWRVEPQRARWEAADAFVDACAELGLPRLADFNRGDNHGAGLYEANQKRGTRWNAARAWLDPIRRRPNLRVLTDATAQRLLLARQPEGAGEGAGGGPALRATGVLLRVGGQTVTARAAREVVLAAGAIGSPQLLQLSGIGPARVLAGAGVRAMHELPGVGENLQDHLQIKMIWRLTGTRTLNDIAASLAGRIGMGLRYLLTRSGPLAMAPASAGAFAFSSGAHARPNVQFHVQPMSLDALDGPLHPFSAITVSVCNLRPASRGAVRIASADAAQAPRIAANFLHAPEDRQVAVDSYRLARRVMAARAFARFLPEEVRPGAALRGDDDLARAAAEGASSIHHAAGTCAMGPDPAAGAVVDARLRVHGIAGLRVADASIMPTIPSGNTATPTVMIGEKAAAMMREDRLRAG